MQIGSDGEGRVDDDGAQRARARVATGLDGEASREKGDVFACR